MAVWNVHVNLEGDLPNVPRYAYSPSSNLSILPIEPKLKYLFCGEYECADAATLWDGTAVPASVERRIRSAGIVDQPLGCDSIRTTCHTNQIGKWSLEATYRRKLCANRLHANEIEHYSGQVMLEADFESFFLEEKPLSQKRPH